MDVITPDGTRYTIRWQQYTVGLYIAVYESNSNRTHAQLCWDGAIEEFLAHLEKEGFKILAD